MSEIFNERDMMYAVISFSHKNVGVALREKLHFDDTDTITLLKQLSNIDGILESMLLATCNRCEIYVYLQGMATNQAMKHDLNYVCLAILVPLFLCDYKV